jgi:uncharacterized coiled-coil DUF342 family protein
MMAEKSIYNQEVEELRQKCEKGCEEVEELRQRLEEVIHVRDMLQEEVQVLARERQNEQQEVSGYDGPLRICSKFVLVIVCPDCSRYPLAP